MSQMNELATLLDELQQTGRALTDCGESLLRTAAAMQRLFEANPQEKPFPVQIPGDAADAPADPDADTAPETPKVPKHSRASKPRPGRTTAGTEAPAPEPAEMEQKEPSPTFQNAKVEQKEPSPLFQEAPQYSKEEIRAMLAGLADNGHREEAKALVQKYADGGSFSNIDPARYSELAEEVKQYA